MTPTDSPRIAVQPRSAGWIDAAVEAGGGTLVGPDDATALVWTSSDDPDELTELLQGRTQIDWVQLPWAGVDPYVRVMDPSRTWTSAKGVYSDPVAEHALALLLGGFRHIHTYARADSWGRGVGRNLYGAKVTILGGGGIAQALIALLVPFGCSVTVVRRRPEAMEGVRRVLGHDQLHEALEGADALVLALPLLPETTGLIGTPELAMLAPGAWVVNVARGAHCDTDALLAALDDGDLGGVALDVTDPEPLPDGHPLWSHPKAIITPHTANTQAMARPLLSARITDNIRRYAAGQTLSGVVDRETGY